MFRKTALGFLLAAFILLSFSVMGLAIGVRPLVIDLNLRPGDVHDFEIILSSTATMQEDIDLSIYQPVQQITGQIVYRKGDAAVYSPVNWIELEKDRVIVPPGQDAKVKGRVQVPYDAGGSYTLILMVEPVVDESAMGVVLRVRYAVRIDITVDRAGLRPRAEVVEFGLQADDQRLPVLMAHVQNPSPLHYRVFGEATIRDNSRRLVERVVMRTEAAHAADQDYTRLYRGAEIRLQASVQEPLAPGEYDVRFFLRYADGLQITRSQQITVREGDFNQRITPLKVEPQLIEATVRPGGVVTQVVQMQNRTGDPVHVKVGTRDIDPEYPRSVFESFAVQYRGEQELELKPRYQGRGVLIFRAPRDIGPGGYYGYVDLNAFSFEGEHLERYPIQVRLLIGEGWESELEMLNAHHSVDQGEHFLSVEVRNKGLSHIDPKGVMYLKDSNGLITKTLALHLPEGVDTILPEQTGYLVTGTVDSIEPGEYMAEIQIERPGQEPYVYELPITIQDEGAHIH